MSSTISAFIIVSAALVLVGAGCGKQEASVKTESETTLPSVSDSPAAYTTPNGWKTAVTPGYKVTVDYPPNWKQEFNADVALMLVAPDYLKSGASFNVVVEPIATLEPLTDETVLGFKKDLEAQGDTVSVDVQKLQTAAGLSYIVEAVTRDPEDGVFFHAAQLFTTGELAGVVATASATEEAWPQYQETMQTLFANLRFSK